MKATPPPQGEPQTQFAIGLSAAPAVTQRSNIEGTCLWCGRKLKPVREHTRPAAYSRDLAPELLLGDYADGRFCKMRCGYAFGVWAAHLGFRLQPREAAPAPQGNGAQTPGG